MSGRRLVLVLLGVAAAAGLVAEGVRRHARHLPAIETIRLVRRPLAGAGEPVLALPVSALVGAGLPSGSGDVGGSGDGAAFVVESGAVRLRRVRLGRAAGGHVEVREGL